MTPYPAYPNYTPSGIDWLGDIPEHWTLNKGKWIWKKEQRPVRDFDDVVTAFRDGIVTLRKNRREDGFTNSLQEIGYQGIRKGDLVIHGMDAFAGAIGVSDSDGKSTPVYAACTPRKDANPYFFAYLLREMSRKGWIECLARGIRERSTEFKYPQFSRLLYPEPPLAEQTAIADFLDRKTAQIDRFLALKARAVELLKERKRAIINAAVTKGVTPGVPLKASGIEWLGDIPAHWEVKKLKHVAKVKNGMAKNASNEVKSPLLVPYLRVANVQDGYLDLDDVAKIPASQDDVKKYSLQKGDLLMNEGGDFDKLGRGYVWNGEISPCLHQNHVFAVRVKKPHNPHWLNLLTLTYYGKCYFISKCKQTTNLASISSRNLSEFPILLPPLEEVTAIMKSIQLQSADIDKAIVQTEREMALMKEYRQALISEAVTGKIKVCQNDKD